VYVCVCVSLVDSCHRTKFRTCTTNYKTTLNTKDVERGIDFIGNKWRITRNRMYVTLTVLTVRDAYLKYITSRRLCVPDIIKIHKAFPFVFLSFFFCKR